MDVLHRYFDALRNQDWAGLGDCVAEDVQRTGPYLDVVRGRDAYLAYLAEVIPTLPNWTLTVHRVHRLSDVAAVVEISETLDVDSVSTRFPEALFFDVDPEGRIARIDIYIKQPPQRRAEPQPS